MSSTNLKGSNCSSADPMNIYPSSRYIIISTYGQPNSANILVFKTGIKTSAMIDIIRPTLDSLPSIHSWSVDIEDIDNVLRIEASDSISEDDIIRSINNSGFYCTPLAD